MPRLPRTQRFRVGALVLTSTALFLGMIAFIVGSSLTTDMATYYILFDENVKGMVVGSKVNFQGVPVGSVRDIRFQEGRTLVEMAIDPGKATLQEVTRGRLDRLLVTGQVTVELEGWQRDARELAQGALVKPSTSAMTELAQTLPDIVARTGATLSAATRLMERYERALDGPMGQRLDSILESADKLTRALPDRLDRMEKRVSSLLAQTQSAIATIDATLGGEETQATIAAARDAFTRLSEVERSMVGLIDETRGLVGAGRSPMLEALISMRDMLGEVGALARQLRVAPSSLIFGRNVKELVVPARAPQGGREE